MNSPMPPSLAALFGGSDAAQQAPDRRGLPEAQVMRLREALERALGGNPFAVGDLVSPRPDATLGGAGDPHVVMETMASIMPSFRTDACCSEKRLDMRVAYIDRRGDLRTHWAESFEWEFWAPALAVMSGDASREPIPAATADNPVA